jgi:TetR/AcrR family transcriptional repressor of lmrAB and yxaGH operons
VVTTEDRTRARLVAAAADRFASHGFSRVSLEEVSTAAGVHRTTLHRHFPGGRDELVLAVLDREAALMAEGMSERIEAADSAFDALVDSATFAVMEGRRSRVVAALLGEPAARLVLLGSAAAQLRTTATGVWSLILERPDARQRAARPPSATRVVDHLFRVILTLVEQPMQIDTEARVRSYFADFVAPALLERGD